VKALITGITGFAGQHLAAHLLSQGDQVRGLSRRSDWLVDVPPALRQHVELIGWDLSAEAQPGPTAVGRITAFEPEVIYHLAAMSVPQDCGSQEPTSGALLVNVEGTRRVMQLATRLSSKPRVLFTSTSRVYRRVSSDAPYVDESSPLEPRGGYGISKLAAEDVARQMAADAAVELIVIRPFQHTGPGQNDRMMLPQWARQIAEGGSVPIEVLRTEAGIDVSDVRDVVRAYRLLAQRGVSGGTYNVGSGVPRTSGQVLKLLMDEAASERPIVELRPGPSQDPIAVIDALVACTGWRPEIPIAQTVADTLADWRHRMGRDEPRSSR
jgi:GDP-4-dehydro-6-deoxy-D-mannose reductase